MTTIIQTNLVSFFFKYIRSTIELTNFLLYFIQVNVSEKALPIDSDDEDKDTIGETRFMKPMKSIRSSSLLHSVEDLSTDSTCVYKAKSGFDSNRGSRRRNKTTASSDEISAKIPLANGTTSSIQTSATRGLSKSMIIPSPVSDFSDFDEITKKKKTCCEKLKRYAHFF